MADNKELNTDWLSFTLGLAHLRDQQRPMLEKLGHYNTDKDTLARYGNALQIEVAEMINELPWKPWKDKPIDLDRVKDEFADVLAFTGTWLCLLDLLGLSVTELAVAYVKKTERNHLRLAGGEAHYGTPGTGYAPSIVDGPNGLVLANLGGTEGGEG